MWDFLPYGPFEVTSDDVFLTACSQDRKRFDAFLASSVAVHNSMMYAAIDVKIHVAEGLLGVLYVAPEHGRLTVGRACFGNVMRRSLKGTEACPYSNRMPASRHRGAISPAKGSLFVRLSTRGSSHFCGKRNAREKLCPDPDTGWRLSSDSVLWLRERTRTAPLFDN